MTGIKRPRHEVTKEMIDDLLKLWVDDDLNQRELAEDIGITQFTLRRILNSEGCEIKFKTKLLLKRWIVAMKEKHAKLQRS